MTDFEKRKAVLLIAAVWMMALAIAPSQFAESSEQSPPSPRVEPRIPIPENEKLVFEVRFSRFPLNVSLGQVTFEYLGKVSPAIPGSNYALAPRDGETFVGFRAHAQSQGMLISLFGLTYTGRYETLIRRDTLAAALSFKEEKDDKKHTSQTSLFDISSAKIRYATRNLANANEPARIVELPLRDRTQSILSAFYYVRLMPLNEDQVNCFLVSQDEQTFDLEVFFRGREVIEVNRQKMMAIRVEPKVFGPGRYFAKRQGDFQLWMTDDERRLPLKLVAKTTQGTVSANLINYLEQPPFRQMGPSGSVK